MDHKSGKKFEKTTKIAYKISQKPHSHTLHPILIMDCLLQNMQAGNKPITRLQIQQEVKSATGTHIHLSCIARHLENMLRHCRHIQLQFHKVRVHHTTATAISIHKILQIP